jgi:hypothetical protein
VISLSSLQHPNLPAPTGFLFYNFFYQSAPPSTQTSRHYIETFYSKKKILHRDFLSLKKNSLVKKNYYIKTISRKTGHDLRNISTLTRLLKINYDYVINSESHVGGLSYLEKFCANVLSDNLTIYNNFYLCLSKPLLCCCAII